MASQWRIRHKLMLGFCLDVGIIALLLTGTLIGLMSYRSTMKSIDSKMMERQSADGFRDALRNLFPNPDELDGPLTSQRIDTAEQLLGGYKLSLEDTLRRRRDPDGGFQEMHLVKTLESKFGILRESLVVPQNIALRDDDNRERKAKITVAVKDLEQGADDLLAEVASKIRLRIRDAQEPYRTSLWIVISTSIVGVCLVAGLLRFFYGWVFYPIRDLQEGSRRIAKGDFDHRIVVKSGDEMEELAHSFNDMTGRLQEMYRDLEHQVNERSRQLVRSERLASVGFLAAGVAHEINNPLASIAFCSEALESRIGDILRKAPDDSEVITKYLRMIQQEAFRCKAITQRLLEFSRSGERRREATDLTELIQSVLDVVQHLQNSKGKQIIFEPSCSLEAWVNAQEIKSVVLNLVVNALDSMDENGTLTITLRQRDQMAEMHFQDTGCGMSAEILENIFEPFFTRSRTGKGTGLGLSISHRVISQHGGEIEATSPGPDQGSAFTVRLPTQPAESVKEDTLANAAA